MTCDIVTDRAGIEPWVARSRVQRLNHWAMKVPERPSCLCLVRYSPLFEIRAPWLRPLSTEVGSFHSQVNPGYHCHQCNGPCGIEPWVARSRVQRLNHWAIKIPEWPSRLRLVCYSPFLKYEPPGSGHLQPRRGPSTHRWTRVTAATSVMDRAGIEPWLARSS